VQVLKFARTAMKNRIHVIVMNEKPGHSIGGELKVSQRQLGQGISYKDRMTFDSRPIICATVVHVESDFAHPQERALLNFG